MGMKAVGLTDHGTFAGAIAFLKECRKQNIKPILGMEAYHARNHKSKSKNDEEVECQDGSKKVIPGQRDGRRGNRHLNLIAKDFTGFQNICILSHRASLDGYYYDPRVDLELLAEFSKSVICTSACLSNVINWNLSIDEYDKAKKAAAGFKDIYGDDFYLEMMYHGIDKEGLILPSIQKLGKELGIKTICTNDCLLPESLILTDSGYKEIHSLSTGDRVCTHNGSWQQVEYVNKRNYSGPIHTIRTLFGSFSIQATSNHPILTAATQGPGWQNISGPVWKSAENVQKGELLCIPKYTIEFAKHKSFEREINTLDWVNPRKCLTKTESGIKSFRLDKKAAVPYEIVLDRHFLQVLGLYLAEGFLDGTVIGFGFHRREKILVDIVCSYFERFNFHPTVTTEGEGCSVRVNSFVFSDIFHKLAGSGAKNKSLPEYSFFTEDELKTVIRYYFEGDGHMGKNGLTYMVGSTSRSLIFYLSEVFKQWGVLSLPTVRDGKKASRLHKGAKSEWNDLYVLNFSGSNLDILNNMFGLEFSGHKVRLKQTHRPKFAQDNSYYYVRINDINFEQYDGDVWNLQVEKDESYTCYGYAVHNCHYLKKEDAEYHEVLLCMSSGRLIKDPNRMKFPYDEFYFKSKEEMAKIFGHVPSVMTNTIEIADKCDYSDIVFGEKMLLPKFDLPEGYSNQFDYLSDLAWAGLKRVNLDKSEAHRARLEQELSDIRLVWDTKRYDFATYFLIVEDIMRYARENNINAGIRGSGFGSLLLKCLNISEGVDPLEQSLLWERFLGFDSQRFISEEDLGIKRS